MPHQTPGRGDKGEQTPTNQPSHFMKNQSWPSISSSSSENYHVDQTFVVPSSSNTGKSSSSSASPQDIKRKRMDSSSTSLSPRSSSDDVSTAASMKSKKQRLSWTNELHDSFVEAVQKLGLANAAPKAIKNLMGVSHITVSIDTGMA